MNVEINLDSIALNAERHSRDTDWWIQESDRMKQAFRSSDRITPRFVWTDAAGQVFSFELSVPIVEMGAITSWDLLGLDELILFSFYSRNTTRYKSVVDLGANIGLHSAVLASLGYAVTAYEPDPVHTSASKTFLASVANAPSLVDWREKAVVPNGANTRVQFVRVLGNTTSSHVAGAKVPYGDIEIFEVDAEPIDVALNGKDLVKMDVEGLEAELLTSFLSDESSLSGCPDILLEVGNEDNAHHLFGLVQSLGANLFSQKSNWARVTDILEMPTSYRDGSLFLTTSSSMPW